MGEPGMPGPPAAPGRNAAGRARVVDPIGQRNLRRAHVILVTGATGTVGSEVVRLLAAAGAPVRALTRDPGKAAGIGGTDVELVQGDLLDPHSLDRALDGVDHAFLLTPFVADQLTPQLNLIEAAARKGGVHVVKMGVIGASVDGVTHVSRQHGEGDRRLKETGLEWTLVQPHSFMQNLLGMAGSIVTDGVFYGASGDGRIASIDARDIAAVAAAALLEPGHVGKEYVVTGPASLSHADMAATLSRVLGRDVRYVDVTADQYRASLRDWGLAEPQIDDLTTLYADIFRRGGGDTVTTAVQEATGRAARTFEQFAQDHAAAFRG